VPHQTAGQDKAAGLLQVLRIFPQYTPEQVLLAIANDETLFDASYFPVSVGVASAGLREPTDSSAYVTTSAEGEGFCELARYL